MLSPGYLAQHNHYNKGQGSSRMQKMKILFLTKYGRLGASSRYRAYQYLEYLRQDGFKCSVAPLFANEYLLQLYRSMSHKRTTVRLMPDLLSSMIRRFRIIVARAGEFDAVWLEGEALPYVPMLLEQFLFRANARVVVDYDDAIYTRYAQHKNSLIRRLLQQKIARVVGNSCRVIVANGTLAQWAKQFNSNVTIIPTSVDLRKYALGTSRLGQTNEKPVIGWIGTPMTVSYLRELAVPLRELRTRHDFILKVIGAEEFRIDGVETITVPWSEGTEVAELQSCTIGVMPLTDGEFERGKSALKLIQYMAAGLAAVASPVGANSEVIEPNKNGLIAATGEEWVQALAGLIEQPEHAHDLARASRRSVEERYSVQVNAPRLASLLRSAATRPSNGNIRLRG
jgi:glycosyltransferase involved in cell wall biosynthesis